jgi:hypothetical protein
MAQFGIRHDVLRASRSTIVCAVLQSYSLAFGHHEGNYQLYMIALKKLSLFQLPYIDQHP